MTCSVIYKRLYRRVINLLPKCVASQAVESCWHLCLLGSVTVTCQAWAEGRKCHELVRKCFMTALIEKACSCTVVRESRCSVPRQWTACRRSALCSVQGLRSCSTETNLGVMFLGKEVSPFPSLLSFRCREGVLPSSTVCASLTTCHSSFLPVSVSGRYVHL